MAFEGLTTVVVFGHYDLLDATDTPATGWVQFTMRLETGFLRDAGGSRMMAPRTYKAILDASGNFAQALPVTDDPAISPVNFTYRVTPHIFGVSRQQKPFDIAVPSDSPGGRLDLASVLPVTSSTGTISYILLKGDPGDPSTVPGPPGTSIRGGAGAPSNGLGSDGDYYLDTSTADLYLKSAGTYSVVVNLHGTDGANGSTWRSGAGVPSNGLGIDGDYYLNTTTSDLYLRASGTYSIVVNLKGAAGTDGTNGTNGTAGTVWRSGSGAPSNGTGVDGDFYLNTATSDVYLRASGTYSIVLNIKGATGTAGTNGTNGAPGAVWRSGSGVPSNGTGIDGDFYLNTATSDVYQRASGTYGIVVNIKGATGTAGAVWRDGAGVPSNGTGVDGDYYLNDTTGDIYKRASGTYSIVGSLASWIAAVQTDTALNAAQIAAFLAPNYTVTGGAVSVNGTTAGLVDIAAGKDFIAPGSVAITAQAAQPALFTVNATTVAAGSNGVHTNTFAGSGVLSVASVTGFPTSGTLVVTQSTLKSVITYTNVSGSTFTGCTLVNAVDITMATGNTVNGSNASTTDPRWAILEVDGSGVLQLNLGAAATPPVIPDITAGRTAHAAVAIPANATAIDQLYYSVPANAKLFEFRSQRPPAGAIQQDVGAQSSAVNPTTLTSALTGTLPLLWNANELAIGDDLEIELWGKTVLAVASTVEIKLLAAAVAIFDYTTASVTHTSGNEIRYWYQRVNMRFTAIGASGTANCFIKGELSPVTAGVFAAGAAFENMQGQHGITVDTTTLTRLDVQALIATGNASNQLQCFGCIVKKFPH